MRRVINFCSQGDVEHPCTMRVLVPVSTDKGVAEYVKICGSKFPQACCKVPMELDFQTWHVFHGYISE